MTRRVAVFDDPESLSLAGAKLVASCASATAGPFTWVLAGGRTPRRLYELVAEGAGGPLPWPSVHLLWGDERLVAPTHPDSNFRVAFESLISKVPIPSSNVHRAPAEIRPPDAAALAYEAELRALLGERPAFDLVLLGLGTDGHTASLFPGSPALAETSRWVLPTSAPEGVAPQGRLTLTLPALNLARLTLFLVSGADKASAVREILGGSSWTAPFPASRIKPMGPVLWLLDRAAAGAL